MAYSQIRDSRTMWLAQDLIGVCQTLESEISSSCSDSISTAKCRKFFGNEESICTVFITHVLSEMNEKVRSIFRKYGLALSIIN